MQNKTDATTRATALLAASDKTELQLRDALLKRGYEPSDVEIALQQVRSLGYLDDARVARRRAKAELEAGWAGEALMGRLIGAGLHERLAQEALAQAIVETGWTAEVAAQRLAARRKLSGQKGARFLASRGFEEDLVFRLFHHADE